VIKGRTALFVTLGLGSLAYGWSLMPMGGPAVETSASSPWYQTIEQPPQMVRLPDAPLILAPETAEIDPEIVEINPTSPRIGTVAVDRKPTPPVYAEVIPDSVIVDPVISLPQKEETVIEPERPKPEIAQVEQAFKPRWHHHAVAINPSVSKPWIAVVIDDLGLDQKRTARMTDLTGPLTMAFIPYARNLPKQATAAQEKGHELLLHLPMEPLNEKLDAGPNQLHTKLSPETIRARIDWNLARFQGYIGVNNHMGSRATADRTIMTILMEELRKRELIFLDSRTNPKSLGQETARAEKVPFVGRNVFLDNVNDKDTVLKQFATLEKIAKKRGHAVGIGHPREGTIQALQAWLPTLKAKGITLVPLSHIVLYQSKEKA